MKKKILLILSIAVSALVGNIYAETKIAPTSTLDETAGNIVVLLETASYAQGDPYNRLCPLEGTNRTKTGCGPTAFAILCQYYKWPEHGTGSVTHMGETLDLSTHYYDYDNMLNSYSGAFTDAQATAVATLMRDLGYATKVTYGLSGTSFSETIREFKSNFNFTNSIYNPTGSGINALYRSDTDDESFMQMIKDNLDQGYPVLFSALSYDPEKNERNGRHIFILDGYTDNNYFHFNFGWGGNGNGWYTLDNMTVDKNSDYSTEQRIYPYVIPNKTKYSINVSASPEGAGSVSASPTEQFEGSNVTLTAIANSGYSFQNWTRGGEIVSYEKSFATKATTNEASNTYVANFLTVGTTNISIPVSYNSSYGTVTYNGSAVQGTGIVAKENQEVTLKATPVEGYTFSGWKVEEGTNSYYVYTQDLTLVAKNGIIVTAEFTLAVVDYVVSNSTGTKTNASGSRSSIWTYNPTSTNPVALQLTSTSGVTEVYGLSNTYERYYAYAYDSATTGHTPVTYTLSVPEGYVITGYNITYWVSSYYIGQVTISNGTTTNTPTVTDDQYLSASGLNAQSTSFTLEASSVGQQYITVESFTVTIKKNSGSDPVIPVTKYAVTVAAGEGGTATASASEVESGKTVTLTATPAEGYEFDYWGVGTSKVSSDNPYTATITANTEFIANFKKKAVTKYAVTVVAGDGGTATVSASEVESGKTVTLTATPAEGYVFDYWSVGTTEVSKDNPYTATITANTEYTANFKVKPVTKYTVTVTAGTGGTASASATEVESGGTVVLTAEAAEGYVFDHWSVGTTEVSKDNPYTATITANTEYTANFIAVQEEELSYCTPSGDTYTDNFLTSITTTDADVNVNYTASSHPGSALFVVPTVVEVAPGGSFKLNLVANSLGAGSNYTVREDIRYCHVSLFTDFDRDGDFGSAISKWGNNGGTLPAPSHNVYGNYDEVMKISTTINVPATAAEGVSHIRVVYQNAWKEFPEACTTALEKGIAYDIEVRVVSNVVSHIVTIEEPANGTVAATSGGVAVTSGSTVADGAVLTLSNTPARGHRFVNYIVNGVETTESTITVTEDVTISAVFAEGIDYCQPTGVAGRSNPDNVTYNSTRAVESILVSDGISEITVEGIAAPSGTDPREIVKDQTDKILTTVAGKSITLDVNGVGTWMNTFVYADWDLDGFTSSDQVYQNYTLKNQTTEGNVVETQFAISIPGTQEPGTYRVRYILDWNNTDPCKYGQASNSNSDNDNGEVVIDFMIRVLPKISYTVSGNGDVVVADGYTDEGTEGFRTQSVIANGSALAKEIRLIFIPKQHNGNVNTIAEATINGEDIKEYLIPGIYYDYQSNESPEPYNAESYWIIVSANQTEDQNVYVRFEGNVQGIGGIGVEGSNGPVEYYNLQGVRVEAENLTPGFYIVRQGGKVAKVLIK